MQIIIPMSGLGTRFLKAGYKEPKPLIEVDGKPIIAHVIGLFPGESKFIFVCNKDHLRTTQLKQVLTALAPDGKIVAIEPHKKGPVYAVAQAFDVIDNDDETIVTYCDFAKFWDYQDFLTHTRTRRADGAVSAYRGFHPHMLGSTNYAFIKEDGRWLSAIQEKKPFTADRMQEFASDGTYYFRQGKLVKKYFQQLMDEDINLNGEYYVSLIYNLMVRDKLKVSVYEIQHMLQWGEPKDLQEYRQWSRYFAINKRALSELQAETNSINLIPLAGRGQRFVDAGYQLPKPLIEVSGKPMVVQAHAHLPPAVRSVFVCRKDHVEDYQIDKKIREHVPSSRTVVIDGITEGQAVTCALGLEGEDLEAPVFIGASDNGMLWSAPRYRSLLADPSVACVVFSFRHHPSSALNPQMYGWIKVDGQDNVQEVSVKVPISADPYNDHAIVAAFYFRKVKYFLEAVRRLREKNIRVNNEFYVDSCINEIIGMGLKAKVFECDQYISWGTPADLKTFEYWQSFFHKAPWHSYRLEKDLLMEASHVSLYDKKYREFAQPY